VLRAARFGWAYTSPTGATSAGLPDGSAAQGDSSNARRATASSAGTYCCRSCCSTFSAAITRHRSPARQTQQIAYEVSRAHPTWLSGRDTGQIPVRVGGVWDRLLTPPFWFFASRVLTVKTPIGRKARPKMMTVGAPLERVKSKDLAAAGIERVPRTVGVRDGFPALEDGRVMNVSNVIWCTGFRPDFGWIDLPVFGEDGEPVQERGVVESAPGLYFLSRFFLYAFTSSLIGGV
jgi:hypothetical protein